MESEQGTRRVTREATRHDVTLPCEPSSAAAARRFVASTLTCPEPFDMTVALLVSELASNAVLHAHTAFTVTVARHDGIVQVSVTDANPQPPVMKHYDQTSITGRGLRILATAASRWGWDVHEHGKTVWFEIDDAIDKAA